MGEMKGNVNWCHFMENEWAMDGTLMDNGWMVHSWKIKLLHRHGQRIGR